MELCKIKNPFIFKIQFRSISKQKIIKKKFKRRILNKYKRRNLKKS